MLAPAEGGTVIADVTLLTGATSGVGRAAAPRLAEDGGTVLVTGRNRQAGEAVVDEVEAAHPDAEGRCLRVDFADFAALRDLARTVRRDYDRLDALVNNAGTAGDDREFVDGLERTFTVNHLAPFLLTACLAARLSASAPARVVTTSSALHRRGDCSDLDAVIAGTDYDTLDAYADSKLANVVFTCELADRLADDGVAAAAFHSGWVPTTGLFRDASVPTRLFVAVAGLAAHLAAVGPLQTTSTAGAALADLVADRDLDPGSPMSVDRGTPMAPAPAATGEALRSRLWSRSAELVGVPAAVPAADPLA